jgi:hypothetical protein
VNRRCEQEVLEVEYHDSLPLSFFLSCGNVMAAEKEVTASFYIGTVERKDTGTIR